MTMNIMGNNLDGFKDKLLISARISLFVKLTKMFSKWFFRDKKLKHGKEERFKCKRN